MEKSKEKGKGGEKLKNEIGSKKLEGYELIRVSSLKFVGGVH